MESNSELSADRRIQNIYRSKNPPQKKPKNQKPNEELDFCHKEVLNEEKRKVKQSKIKECVKV